MKKIERIIILRKHKYNDFKVELERLAFLSKIDLFSYLSKRFEFKITTSKDEISKLTFNQDIENKEKLFFSNKKNYTEGLFSLEVVKVFTSDTNFHFYRKPTKLSLRNAAEERSKVFNKNSDKQWKVKLVKLIDPKIGLMRNKKTRKFLYWNGTSIDAKYFEFFDLKLSNNNLSLSVTKDFLINKCGQKTMRSLKYQIFIEGVDFVIKGKSEEYDGYADIWI